MLAKKQYDYKKVLFRLILASSQEDLYIFLYAIKKLYPEYLSTACEFINNNVIIGYNMFIMKKAEFDKFANGNLIFFSKWRNTLKYLDILGQNAFMAIMQNICYRFIVYIINFI